MSLFRDFLGGWRLKRRLGLARRLARRADDAHDVLSFSQAAEAYRAALAPAPMRPDIRVQYGNMLKDAGRLAEAESAYRSALGEKPDNADIHLQLGHCLKLQGRRTAALAAYERAAKLTPFSIAPHHELCHMGQRRNQEYLFEAQLRLGGVEALTAITHQVVELRETLNRLVEALPDIQAQMAFPLSCYDSFRACYDIPKPLGLPNSRPFAILLLADREPLETLFAQLAAVRSQAYESWTLSVIGCDPARKRIVERASASDARIRWADIMEREGSAEAERRIALSSGADWILLLAQRALLHLHAIGWFALLAGQSAATAFITDEETGTRERGHVRRSCPQFRQVVDYDTLLEMNTCGETVAVERAAYASAAQRLVTSSVSASRSSLLLALARDGRVGHIPCLLICRDGDTLIEPAVAAAEHAKAVQAHILQAGLANPTHIARPRRPFPPPH